MGDMLKTMLTTLSSESPEFKRALKILIKYEIYTLLQRLSDVGEEAVVITASPDDGANGHLGTDKGEGFMRQSHTVNRLKEQFLLYCCALSNISASPQIKEPENLPDDPDRSTVLNDDRELSDATAQSLLTLSLGQPRVDVQPAAKTAQAPETDMSPRRTLPETDVSMRRTLLETDVSMRRTLPETDVSMRHILPETDVSMRRTLPETDVSMRRTLPETDVSMRHTLPETDVSMRRTLPETDLSMRHTLPETDVSMRHTLPDVSIRRTLPETDVSIRHTLPSTTEEVAAGFSEPASAHAATSRHSEVTSRVQQSVDTVILNTEPVDLSGSHDQSIYHGREQTRDNVYEIDSHVVTQTDGRWLDQQGNYPKTFHQSKTITPDTKGDNSHVTQLMEVKCEPVDDPDYSDVHERLFRVQQKTGVTETMSSIELYERLRSGQGCEVGNTGCSNSDSDAGNNDDYIAVYGKNKGSTNECVDYNGSQPGSRELSPIFVSDCGCARYNPLGACRCSCTNGQMGAGYDTDTRRKLELCRNIFPKGLNMLKDSQAICNFSNDGRNVKLEGYSEMEHRTMDLTLYRGKSVLEMKGKGSDMPISCVSEAQVEKSTNSSTVETSPSETSLHSWSPLRFGCHCCGQIFKNRQYRDIHEKIHEPKYKYICAICGEGFELESRYQAHQETHTEPMLQCEHCGYRAQKKFRMNMHKEICGVTSRIYSCPYCGKQFSAKRYMKVHMKSHDMMNIHQCPFCQNTYPLKNSLLKHIKKKHTS